MKHIELETNDVLGTVSRAQIDAFETAGKESLAKLTEQA